MKHTQFLGAFTLFALCVFTGCDNLIDGGNPDGHSIGIFRFTDTAYLQKIVAIPIPTGSDSTAVVGELSRYCRRCGDYYIPTFPRLRAENPLFICTDQLVENGTAYSEVVGDKYELCELATASKYIPLKNGFYICYPYISFRESTPHIFLNADWRDICTIDFDTVQPLNRKQDFPYTPVYGTCYTISERKLVKLTGKSTVHFKGRDKQEITIADVVDLFNRLLEEETIDKYCTFVHYDYDVK